MPQLRQNIVTGEWVVIAPERAKRPSDFIVTQPANQKTSQPENKQCPFCVPGENYTHRNQELETESIYLIRNKYPYFIPDAGLVSPRSVRVEHDFYVSKPALGDSDVVIIKDHQTNIYHFSHTIWQELLSVFSRRYQMLKTSPHIEYMMAIYNHGVAAGASIDHPHAQIVASSVVTNTIRHELEGAQSYFEQNGSCVWCDMVHHEIAEKTRILFENDEVLCFTFYAARFPFEIWIVPKRHQSQFEEEPAEVLRGIAEALAESFRLLGATLQEPACNFFLHSLPTTIDNADFYHWHIEIAPRVSLYGGYELGSGVIVDVVSPEKAAGYLLAHHSPTHALD